MKIIPKEKIKHLMWNEKQEVPNIELPTIENREITANLVEELLNRGKEFFDNRQENDKYVGVSYALEDAISSLGENGIIASMPLLIASKVKADKTHDLWKKWYTVYTEELIGVDENGVLGNKGESLVLTIHNGGLLTPDRIRKAYEEGLNRLHAAKLFQSEFNSILNGIVPDSDSPGGIMIDRYSIDDVRNGKVENQFGKYMIYMNLNEVKNTKSNYHSKNEFLNNTLVIARNGGLENLEKYFDKAKSSNKVGNWHRLDGINPREPSGRLLCLSYVNCGLLGIDYLDDSGRFVGVAPEVLGGGGAKK